jgi:uncharacterized protein (UPF0371 family)
MIHTEWMKQLERYSFIDKVERKGLKYYFYYTVKGKETYKTLPLRATVTMVQKLIDKIKEEVGVTIYGKASTRITGF